MVELGDRGTALVPKLLISLQKKLCPSDTNNIFANVANKPCFIRFLGNLVERDGINVIYCKGDADTTILNKALETDGKTAVVFADDTDVFCLLMHHTKEYNEEKNIYLKNMKTCARTGERTTHKIRTIISG